MYDFRFCFFYQMSNVSKEACLESARMHQSRLSKELELLPSSNKEHFTPFSMKGRLVPRHLLEKQGFHKHFTWIANNVEN